MYLISNCAELHGASTTDWSAGECVVFVCQMPPELARYLLDRLNTLETLYREYGIVRFDDPPKGIRDKRPPGEPPHDPVFLRRQVQEAGEYTALGRLMRDLGTTETGLNVAFVAEDAVVEEVIPILGSEDGTMPSGLGGMDGFWQYATAGAILSDELMVQFWDRSYGMCPVHRPLLRKVLEKS